MNNHNYNNLTIKSNKSNPGLQDSDTSLKSPNSPSSPERKHCAFVRDLTGYGFKITGNAPVKVQAVRQKGSAWNAGLRANDIIIKVNGTDVIAKQHSDVVALIRKQTMVELIVKAGENVSSSNISHIPTKAIPRSPRNNNSKPVSHDNAKAEHHKPFSKPVPEAISPRENSKQSSSNKSSFSDHSRRSTESGSKIGDTSSDGSISTTSTETDWNSDKKCKNQKKTSKLPALSDNVPRKPQAHRPKKSVKPNPAEPTEFISNKISSDKLNLFKGSSSSDKELTVKSHSYNAPSNKSSKMFPNSKKSNDATRNKTIPSDGVKSNNMLSSDHGTNEFAIPQIPYDTLPKQLSPNKSNHLIPKSRNISNRTHIMGREFDIDNRGEEDSDVSLSIVDLLSSTEDSISRPGLASVLLLYVNELPNDLNTMMLYYACKFYKTFEFKKDFHTDAPRLANEIITTFLLEKSPLFVNIGPEIVDEILKHLKLSDSIKGIFNSLLKFLFHRLETIVENVKGRIQRGMLLQNELPSLTNEENRDLEVNLLHRSLCNIINKNYKEPDPSDFLVAKQIGLATIFQYFYKPSFAQSSHLRSRSTDGLSTLGNQVKLLPIADLYKVNLFCSAYQQKLFSSIRKKPKSVNGHSIIEAVCQGPEDCAVCDGLLWGPSPQGVFCTMCQTYFHMNCKKKIKASCTRKSRKTVATSGNKEEKTSTTFLGRLSRKSSTSSIKNINSHAAENNQIAGSSIFTNSSMTPDEKTNFHHVDDNIGVFKAKSEDQLHRMNSNSARYGSVHDISSLNHNNSIDNNMGGIIINDTGTVQVQELVQDESTEDPDMKVDESFDAGAEIQATFPNIDSGVDKNRLIVLLEFYHKTRYILMNLKRFLYKLVNKWPQNQLNYFKALSLDCVEPFVILIKSLVTTIKNSVQDQGFLNLETAVYNWLSEDNDRRLKEWITLSSNLCCTNSLNIVKQLKQTTMRAIPELTNLLNAKMHKMIIVEELTQIRPLLISLPLIVKNIIKCLSKSETLYSEQLTLWKETSIKMDYLCEYIDKFCVPLVDWVNNGFITKRTDRNDWSSRIKDTENTNVDIIDYCADFPRTIFHFPIFDFQMAKIFSWYKNIKKGQGPETQIHYMKKGTEVLLIFYKSFIAVLQKENDHYFLKPIKPLKSITERLYPIIETSGSHVSKGGQEEDSFILNIITDKNSVDASLVRVGFSHKEFVDNWIDYLGTFTHNLARSISLYKLNDIKEFPRSNSLLEPNNNFLGRLRTSESFSSYSTVNVPPVVSTPVQPESKNEKPFQGEKVVPESPITEKEVTSSSEELLNELTKSVNILNDQKKEISKFLNIPDEHYDNVLELITKQGPKTMQDTTLLLYSLCGPMIEHTRQLILAGSEDPKINESVKNDDIKETVACILNLYKHLESVKYPNDVIQKPMITERKNSKRKLINTPSSVSRIQLVSDLCDLGRVNSMTPNEIIEDVQDIIDEIIDKSVVQVQKPREPVIRNSYKYIPEKCLISSTRDSTERSSVNLMPTYLNLNPQMDDTIVTTRAQIVLNKTSNNSI